MTFIFRKTHALLFTAVLFYNCIGVSGRVVAGSSSPQRLPDVIDASNLERSSGGVRGGSSEDDPSSTGEEKKSLETPPEVESSACLESPPGVASASRFASEHVGGFSAVNIAYNPVENVSIESVQMARLKFQFEMEERKAQREERMQMEKMKLEHEHRMRKLEDRQAQREHERRQGPLSDPQHAFVAQIRAQIQEQNAAQDLLKNTMDSFTNDLHAQFEEVRAERESIKEDQRIFQEDQRVQYEALKDEIGQRLNDMLTKINQIDNKTKFQDRKTERYIFYLGSKIDQHNIRMGPARSLGLRSDIIPKVRH